MEIYKKVIIKNNCPNCGRAISVKEDEINGILHCYFCDCEIDLEYEMLVDSNNVETEVVIFKTKS